MAETGTTNVYSAVRKDSETGERVVVMHHSPTGPRYVFTPAGARALATSLIEEASNIDGKVTTVITVDP